MEVRGDEVMLGVGGGVDEILKNITAVIPDGIVLGVLHEEFGSECEGIGIEVVPDLVSCDLLHQSSVLVDVALLFLRVHLPSKSRDSVLPCVNNDLKHLRCNHSRLPWLLVRLHVRLQRLRWRWQAAEVAVHLFPSDNHDIVTT